MIIEKNYTKFVVFSEDTLGVALNKISSNKSRLVFVVSEGGMLQGAISDGDVRRWLLNNQSISLNVPVSKVMNRDCAYMERDADPAQILAQLSDHILAVPLVDGSKRLVAVALPGARVLDVAGRKIGEGHPAFLIAEIGNNHNGSLEHALHLIDLAADAGADCAKFQMRDMSAMYRQATDGGDASEDLGAQYTLDLLSRFQLSDEEMFKAFDHSQKRGLVPMCTPWDLSSLEKLERYGLPAYKIASADFTNYDLLRAVAETNKPMICSTGMSQESEVLAGVEFLNSVGAQYVLLHCNSTYPTPDKDIHLRYLPHLSELADGFVGYSGHERGYSVPVAAVAMGARVIEKHFTTDKAMEGNDHKVSLLPEEFSNMVMSIRQVETAMGQRGERSLSQGELMNREVLAKSLIAKADIPAGTPITEAMLDVKSPGQGLQPNRKDELIGTVLKSDKKVGDYFYASDLKVGFTGPRDYRFENPFGIPVRYHDIHALREMSNLDLLEIHLSYKDMELDFRDYLKLPLDLGLVVHAPELFSGDHTLDLCSPSEIYRERSISELQRVINLTRELSGYFLKTDRPVIVTNVGGFSSRGPMSLDERQSRYAMVEESLALLDREGVEIIPQTMPPYPWHFGGQQFHNLFVDGHEIRNFCERNDMRVCLDISHSQLACTHNKISMERFMELVAPFAAHYHLADAKGVDGEGLQIGDGEIDWVSFFRLMQKHSPKATFIPEIWQGHKNNGEGGWIALERLEKFSIDNA